LSGGKLVRLGDSNGTAIILKYLAMNLWFRHRNIDVTANLDKQTGSKRSPPSRGGLSRCCVAAPEDAGTFGTSGKYLCLC